MTTDASFGLSYIHADILRTLEAAERSGRSTKTERIGAFRELKALEKAGYVTHTKAGHRTIYWRLTEQGTEALKKL